MYDFQEQVNDQRQKDGCIAVRKYLLSLGEDITDVSENNEYFKRGIDLIRKCPDEEYIDVKTDFIAHQTGNIPIELVEVCGKNGFVKLGWLFSPIHEVIFYIWETKEMYQFKIEKLKDTVFGRPIKAFASPHIKPSLYFTLGVLLSLEEIKEYKLLK